MEIKGFQIDDLTWYDDNLEELAEMYPNQWIAISNQKIIAKGKSVNEVLRQVRNHIHFIANPSLASAKIDVLPKPLDFSL